MQKLVLSQQYEKSDDDLLNAVNNVCSKLVILFYQCKNYVESLSHDQRLSFKKDATE